MPQGAGVSFAIEWLCAILDLGLRRHQLKPGPGIDVAADQRDLAVGMLRQGPARCPFLRVLRRTARTGKVCGSVPRVTPTRSPLRSAPLANSLSSSPFCFKRSDSGLQLAQSMRISVSASAAKATRRQPDPHRQEQSHFPLKRLAIATASPRAIKNSSLLFQYVMA